MNTAPFSNWDDATELFPWGADSFGVWLFLIIAVVLFVAALVRAVQHENEAMVHVVEASMEVAAKPEAEAPEPEKVVAAG